MSVGIAFLVASGVGLVSSILGRALPPSTWQRGFQALGQLLPADIIGALKTIRGS